MSTDKISTQYLLMNNALKQHRPITVHVVTSLPIRATKSVSRPRIFLPHTSVFLPAKPQSSERFFCLQDQTLASRSVAQAPGTRKFFMNVQGTINSATKKVNYAVCDVITFKHSEYTTNK
jgi:hypothetical protein